MPNLKGIVAKGLKGSLKKRQIKLSGQQNDLKKVVLEGNTPF